MPFSCVPYGPPTADPTPAQIVAGVNLADVGKCSCSSKYCAAAAAGWVPISSGNGSAVVTLRANLPPFPFDNLGADATCSDCKWSSRCGLCHLHAMINSHCKHIPGSMQSPTAQCVWVFSALGEHNSQDPVTSSTHTIPVFCPCRHTVRLCLPQACRLPRG